MSERQIKVNFLVVVVVVIIVIFFASVVVHIFIANVT